MSTSTTEYRDYLSPFVNKFVNQGRYEGEAKGEVKGEAKALLVVLAARGVAVWRCPRPDLECTELEQLETWVRRAATASSVDQLFG